MCLQQNKKIDWLLIVHLIWLVWQEGSVAEWLECQIWNP